MTSTKIKELAKASGIEPDEKAVAFAEAILSEVDSVIGDLYQTLPLEIAVILLDLDMLIKDQFYGE